MNIEKAKYTFYKDIENDSIGKYCWCQRPCDTNMSLKRFVVNGEIEGFVSESLAYKFEFEQIDLNTFMHEFVKPIIKDNIELKAKADKYDRVKEKIKEMKKLAKDCIEQQVIMADSDSLNFGRVQAYSYAENLFEEME